MMYWTKDKFVFRDDTCFGTAYRNLAIRGGSFSANDLSKVVFPIKVTEYDVFGVKVLLITLVQSLNQNLTFLLIAIVNYSKNTLLLKRNRYYQKKMKQRKSMIS